MAKTPDQWISWYYTVCKDAGAPALQYTASRGYVFAEKCGSCGGKHRQVTKDQRYVCGSCTTGKGHNRRATPWPIVERLLLKGEVQDSLRIGSTEHRISKRVDIGTLLAPFLVDSVWEWDAKLYVANVMRFSIAQLVREGPDTFPDAPVDWTHWNVRQAINRGRGEWTRRLDVAGIEYERDFN